jgi:hypothetical protein
MLQSSHSVAIHMVCSSYGVDVTLPTDMGKTFSIATKTPNNMVIAFAIAKYSNNVWNYGANFFVLQFFCGWSIIMQAFINRTSVSC